ncbi:HPP family protein [Akkermansiaceae bacterium]|nr:HPP family protein [Akkermansiaceae bacterium]
MILTLGIISVFLFMKLVSPETEAFIPSMGAAAVLFTSPKDSSLSDFILLNLAAAFIGIACAKSFDNPALATALALTISLSLMQLIQRPHPPAGATAVLTALLKNDASFSYLICPLLPNLLIMSIAFRLIKHHSTAISHHVG